MNLTYLKYALEVERTGSITKAAQQLFMAQPNLSKAIKELEESIGLIIFERTPKGVFVTQEGREFLNQARYLIDQINQMEQTYKPSAPSKLYMNISVPSASYIAYALGEWIEELEEDQAIEIHFKEGNILETIKGILDGDMTIGIIRYCIEDERNLKHFIENRGIEVTTLLEFHQIILMSERHPLAHQTCILQKDLMPYMQLIEGNLNNQELLEKRTVKNNQGILNKSLRLYDRGNQWDLLKQLPTTYMYSCPIPKVLLAQHHLIQCQCAEDTPKYKDVLIYVKQHHFSTLEKEFIKKIVHTIQQLDYI